MERRVRLLSSRQLGRIAGAAQNPVIGNLRMRDVSAWICRHVALSAVGILDMMLVTEAVSVTGKTLLAVISDAVPGRGRTVRIMTACTRHGVAAFLFAHAVGKGLNLTHGTQFRFGVAVRNVMANVVSQPIAGLELISMAAAALDPGFPFQMALHANRVAPIRCQLGRIDDWPSFDVFLPAPVTAFAADSRGPEDRRSITVLGSWRRSFHLADVAA